MSARKTTVYWIDRVGAEMHILQKENGLILDTLILIRSN